MGCKNYFGDVIGDRAYCVLMYVFNGVANILSILGQGGHAYLKEWLWWAGLLSSKYQKYNLLYIISLNGGGTVVTKNEQDGDSTTYGR